MAKIKANQLDISIAIQSVITDATLIADLQDVNNWDVNGDFTGTIPNDLGEGDYIYEVDANGEYWMYQFSQGAMYRIPHKVFEGFLVTPPSLGGVSWAPWKAFTGLNYWTGTVAGVKRGSMWTDPSLGYTYMAFEDDVVTRMGGLEAATIIEAIDNSFGNRDWREQLLGDEIVTLINSELGNTNWQLAGGGGGTPVLITDITLISDLQDNSNWNSTGDYTGTIPGGLAEGAYYYGVSSDSENWLYQYSDSTFYRVPSKVFNAFITPLNVSGVTWTEVTADFATGALPGVSQGQLWQDATNGYMYMSFADDTITRYGGLTATGIIAAIDGAIGTDWKTGGSGSGSGNLITDLTFIAALQNDGNWTDDITYTGTIASGTAEGDYLISQSSMGNHYMYVYTDSTMYRIQFYIPNAFITAIDVSAVTWNVNGVYAYGTLAAANQGDIWKDDVAGYMYICFTDGTIHRFGGGAGTSETGATIEAKLDAHLADPEWKENHSSIITDVAFITALTTESNWNSSGVYSGGAVPADIDEGDYFFGNSTDSESYFYKYINGTVRRMPANLANAFVTAPDVSGVTWTDVADFSYGALAGVTQGDLWQDKVNGYLYICFIDDEITRLAFTAGGGGSMTDVEIVTAVNNEIGNTFWQSAYDPRAVNEVTASDTVSYINTKLQVVDSATATNQTIPAANTLVNGAVIWIKNIGVGNLTVVRASGTDTIDGVAADYSYSGNNVSIGGVRGFMSNGVDGFYIV